MFPKLPLRKHNYYVYILLLTFYTVPILYPLIWMSKLVKHSSIYIVFSNQNCCVMMMMWFLFSWLSGQVFVFVNKTVLSCLLDITSIYLCSNKYNPLWMCNDDDWIIFFKVHGCIKFLLRTCTVIYFWYIYIPQFKDRSSFWFNTVKPALVTTSI